MPPGPGRSLFLLSEVEIGIGRPDLLFFTASSSAVRSQARRGLRLQNWVEARVLGSWLTGNEMTGVSRQHAASVTKRLRERGWTVTKANRRRSLRLCLRCQAPGRYNAAGAAYSRFSRPNVGGRELPRKV